MHTPNLKKHAEFEKALKNYQPSVESKNVINDTPFVLVVGATSSGRNTIVKQLLKSENYYYVVSDTTRPPRVNNGVAEQYGVEYYFRSEPEMLNDVKAGKFVEVALIHGQQVSGISIREIIKAKNSGKIAITDIEVVGSENILKIDSSVLPIFILPPSFDVWLARINARGAMSNSELRNRLESSVKEFKAALNDDRYIFVVNDKLENAVNAVDEIAYKNLHHRSDEQEAKLIAKKLLQDTTQYLQNLPLT